MMTKFWYRVFVRVSGRRVIHEVYEDPNAALERCSILISKGYDDGVMLDQRLLTRAEIDDMKECGIVVVEVYDG